MYQGKAALRWTPLLPFCPTMGASIYWTAAMASSSIAVVMFPLWVMSYVTSGATLPRRSGFHCPIDHRLQLLTQATLSWKKPMFMDVFLVVAWSLWKEHNNKHFRGIPPTAASWRRRFIQHLSDLTYRISDLKRQFVTAFLATILQ